MLLAGSQTCHGAPAGERRAANENRNRPGEMACDLGGQRHTSTVYGGVGSFSLLVLLMPITDADAGSVFCFLFCCFV